VRDSWTQYDKLAHSADADAAGVQILSGAMFHPTPSKVMPVLFLSVSSNLSPKQFE